MCPPLQVLCLEAASGAVQEAVASLSRDSVACSSGRWLTPNCSNVSAHSCLTAPTASSSSELAEKLVPVLEFANVFSLLCALLGTVWYFFLVGAIKIKFHLAYSFL